MGGQNEETSGHSLRLLLFLKRIMVRPSFPTSKRARSRMPWRSNNSKLERILTVLLCCIAVISWSTRRLLVATTTTVAAADGSYKFSSSLDAIVTISMCGFDHEEMVRALRTHGKWNGPIYVITDDQSKHKNKKDLTNSGDEYSYSYTELNVQGNHPKDFSNEQEFEEYARGMNQYSSGNIYTKWFKTQIFKLIPETDNVQTVLFVDADMLAQRPLSETFLPDIEPLLTSPDCELSLYAETYTAFRSNVTRTGLYNSGMMILKRKESRKLLDRWSFIMVRPPFTGRDQGDLTKAIQETHTNICYLPSRLAHVQNMAELLHRFWFKFARPATFLHIASAKMSKPKEDIQHWNTAWRSRCNYTNLQYRTD